MINLWLLKSIFQLQNIFDKIIMSYDGKDVELLVVGTGKEEPASMWSQTES
jgi:hypothetical protein